MLGFPTANICGIMLSTNDSHYSVALIFCIFASLKIYVLKIFRLVAISINLFLLNGFLKHLVPIPGHQLRFRKVTQFRLHYINVPYTM